MPFPRARCSLRSFLLTIAIVAISFASVQLWRRSEHYRRQAALCAWFELQCRDYAETAMTEWEGLTVKEKREQADGSREESRRFGSLKRIYSQIAHCPWKSLPRDVPASVNPWDLATCSTAEIEEMVRDWDVPEP